MFKKLLILLICVFVSLAITQRETHHLETEDHELFGLGKPDNPKKRTEQQVCEHYGGKMCSALKLYMKCCKDGTLTKNTHCGGVGCEHDTLSISDMRWDY